MRQSRQFAFAFVAAGLLVWSLTAGHAQDEVPETVIRQKEESGDGSKPAVRLPPPVPPLDEATSPEKGTSPSENGTEAEPEVLSHGPVHEGFAGPASDDAETDGLIVDRPPPEPIDEIPPEVAPEGSNVQWIPGYWGWDPEAEDFVWVSGLWRDIPPGQRWVPGHWTEVDGGYRWVSGLFASADATELEYLPYPPESLDQGPNVPSPGSDYFWVPGSWVYQSSDYQWRPGYWSRGYDDWCWVPRYCIWTPRGALWTGGYWDYRLLRRGLLFAPLRFGYRGWYGRGYRFRPYYTINPAGLLVSLFVQPRYRQYYFGDYFGPRYRNLGFRPWYVASGGRGYRDPMYAFYDSYYARRGVDFRGRMDGWQRYFDKHPDRLPPRTILRTANESRVGRDNSPLRLTSSLAQLANGGGKSQVKLNRITSEGRRSVDAVSDQLRSLARERSVVERIVSQTRDGNRFRDDLGARNEGRRSPLADRDNSPILDRADRIVRGNDNLRRSDVISRERERVKLPPVIENRLNEASRVRNPIEPRATSLRDQRQSPRANLPGHDAGGSRQLRDDISKALRLPEPARRQNDLRNQTEASNRAPRIREQFGNRDGRDDSRSSRSLRPEQKIQPPRTADRILQNPPLRQTQPRPAVPKNSGRDRPPGLERNSNRSRPTVAPPSRTLPKLKSNGPVNSKSSGSIRSRGNSSRPGPAIRGGKPPQSRGPSRGRSSGGKGSLGKKRGK